MRVLSSAPSGSSHLRSLAFRSHGAHSRFIRRTRAAGFVVSALWPALPARSPRASMDLEGLRVREHARGVDTRGTEPRTELRFLVDEAVADPALTAVAARLPQVDVDMPWRTTTYCDTEDMYLYREAEAGRAALLRFREYTRRRPLRILSAQNVWIEWKDVRPGGAGKRRFIVLPDDIPLFLSGTLRQIGLDLGTGSCGRDLFRSGLRPVVTVQAERVAYAAPGDGVRITADRQLSYSSIEWPEDERPMVPCPLGEEIARESGVLVEVKWRDEAPGWVRDLAEQLRQASSEERETKFLAATRHALAYRAEEEALALGSVPSPLARSA